MGSKPIDYLIVTFWILIKSLSMICLINSFIVWLLVYTSRDRKFNMKMWPKFRDLFSQDYLTSLHKLHDDWLLLGKRGALPCPVLVGVHDYILNIYLPFNFKCRIVSLWIHRNLEKKHEKYKYSFQQLCHCFGQI